MPAARTFEGTHPWLTFRLDLSKASPKLWLLLGEAQSKVQHVAGSPLLPSVQAYFRQLYLAKGVLATTAIEGNTLSEEEVLRHLEGQLHLPASKQYLAQEIENIVRACNTIGPRILAGAPSELTDGEILEYNRLVLDQLPLNEDVTPGEYRRHRVTVGRYLGAPPQDIELLMQRYCSFLGSDLLPPPGYETHRVAFGILRAIVAHLYMVWIHPFGDGNGRTARLIELRILLGVGVPDVAAHLLSNFYNQTRLRYYQTLDESHRKRDPMPFVDYALRGFVDELRQQIAVIRAQQLRAHWINHVHERFRDQESRTQVRRRRLALDLVERAEPTPLAQIRNLSPRLAAAYASSTDRVIKRDVEHLRELGLVDLGPKGVEARIGVLEAFLPRVRNEDLIAPEPGEG